MTWFYKRYRRTTHDPVAATMQRVAPSIMLSSACLAGGFLVFLSSSLPDYRQFGYSAAACIGLALFWDLLILPRLLAYRTRRGPQA